MLLAIDIGNTNINCGIFRGRILVKRFAISTKEYSALNLKKYLGQITVDDSIICSVVPKATRKLKADLKQLLNKQPYVLGQDIKVPIRNLYRKPKQVGADRLINAYAGIKFYGSPLIIVDFGTAVTFDVLTKKNEYLGGMILAGLEISVNVLRERTALLPRINIKKPKEFIGRDTQSSMLSGMVFGFSALMDELIRRIKQKIDSKAKVIGTGGHISLIQRYCSQIDVIDRDLTIRGLNAVFCAEIGVSSRA